MKYFNTLINLTAQDIYEYMEAYATEQEKKDFKAASFVWPKISVSILDDDGKPIWEEKVSKNGEKKKVLKVKKVPLNELDPTATEEDKIYNASKAGGWFVAHILSTSKQNGRPWISDIGKKLPRNVKAKDLFANW